MRESDKARPEVRLEVPAKKQLPRLSGNKRACFRIHTILPK